MKDYKAIVFDLGGVLIDWNPWYTYQHFFDNRDEMDYFFQNVCTVEWNHQLDLGKPLDTAIAERTSLFPEYREAIQLYKNRWIEMIGGEIADGRRLLKRLKSTGIPHYVLSNWSSETFAWVRDQFDFLKWFDGMVISGEEGLAKPDPAIYELLLDRFDLKPSATLFIDDKPENVDVARSLGIKAIQFESYAKALSDLKKLNFELDMTV